MRAWDCIAPRTQRRPAGKAIQRAIRTQLNAESEQISAAITKEIERLVTGLPTQVVAPADKYLDTEAIAVRLAISEITAARLCKRGEIDADKTSGNQWRRQKHA